MIECAKCKAKTAPLYLCPLCRTELRRQLLRLPTLVDYLYDAAVGHTKMGEGGRRVSPDRALRYNPRARLLAQDIEHTVSGRARGLARRHRLLISPPVTWHRPWDTYTHTTADYVTFLAANVGLLAKDPDVGEFVSQIGSHVRHGIAMINRRIPPQFCGPCPTLITDHRRCVDARGVNTCGFREHQCATRLMARRGAIEVRCPMCGVTHNVERLVVHLLARADAYRCTIPEMYRVLRMLGTPVKHIQILYHWADPKVGKLKPAGYLRPDNRRIGTTRRDRKDTPVYRVSDARSVLAQSAKPGRRGRPLKTEGNQ